MGAVYEIARANNLATIGGVAALSASDTSTITLPKNRLPTEIRQCWHRYRLIF